MSTGKNSKDFLQILDNHIFFNDLTDELLQFFFKVMIKTDSDHGYDEEGKLVDENLFKKKMFEYLLNDTKLLMENIPKVLFILNHSNGLSVEEKSELKNNLEDKIQASNDRILASNISDIINKQFDIFTH